MGVLQPYKLGFILDAHGAVVGGGARVVHSVVLDHDVPILSLAGVEDDLEFLQGGIFHEIDVVLVVGIVPLHDVAVIGSIVPIDYAHVVEGIRACLHTFEVIPIARDHGIGSQGSGDIVVVKIDHICGQERDPAVGAHGHMVVILTVKTEGERKVHGFGTIILHEKDRALATQ